MSDTNLNPSGELYQSFLKILKSLTIKYNYKAEEFETVDTKMEADMYLDAVTLKDNFFTYKDYTRTDYISVGINDNTMITNALNGDTRSIPVRFQQPLLEIRRQRVIDNFEERNNYYRMLNGYPNIEDSDFFYPSTTLVNEYGIDKNIPVHLIQDYYNKISAGKGDYLISITEGVGYIEKLIEANPDKPYLKYIGSNRINLYTSRSAKNFQIIQIKAPDVKTSILDSFVRIYEQCREYFMKTIYISTYKKIIDHYDNFIGMCIMVMATEQLVMNQVNLIVTRDFFDIYSVRALYQAYDIPYNLDIDEFTQNDIIQNLNLLIQNKATDKIIYNIADLLGFSNINVYKYYLSKERKFDKFGVPIVKYTEKFNSDTGETEVVPDYEAMYDIYFQKSELNEDDFISTFNDSSNKVDYKMVTKDDPYWWEDEKLYKQLWETDYNFVESKYLSLGVSYSMTEIMFENILLLKLIISQNENVQGIQISLPRILENTTIPIFDVIILLLCLTAEKHNLYGEIISVPTQVISVLDYIKNTGGDTNLDTLKFNFNYFFNPDEKDKGHIDEYKNDLIDYMAKEDKSDTLVDTCAFDFDYFSYSNKDREKHIDEMKNILGKDDFERFKSFVEVLSTDIDNSSDRVKVLNDMYTGIKELHRMINYYMTETTDRKTYESLKRLYDAIFYSKEMCSVFTITGETTGYKRTAWTYFEYLYHKNPKLYNAIFTMDYEKSYRQYLVDNKLKESDLNYDTYIEKIENGQIFADYSVMKLEDNEAGLEAKDERIYFYVTHIITRIEMIIDNLQFMYLINNTATPLETLLTQLVRYFKSYTTDILGLDTLYVCDFKQENIIRLFDEIHYIKKLIATDEKLELSHGDLVHKIETILEDGDNLFFDEKTMTEVTLLIDELYGTRNSVRMIDSLGINKVLNKEDYSLETMHDEIPNISTEQTMKDSNKLTDKICKMWYTD